MDETSLHLAVQPGGDLLQRVPPLAFDGALPDGTRERRPAGGA